MEFKFSLMNPLSTCVIYSETFSNADLSGSGGSVVLALGNGVRSYPAAGGMEWYDAFNNATISYTCQAAPGPPPTFFSPTLTSNRRLVMQFNDGSPNGWQTLPPMDINSVPYAMFAETSEKLGTNTAADFILGTNVPSCTGSDVLTRTAGTFTCVTAAAATSMNPSGLTAGGASTGQVLKFDGANWVPSSDNTGVVGTLSGDVTGSIGSNALATVVLAGTGSKITYDAKGRVTASVNLNSADITTALGYTPGSGGGTVGSVTSAATTGNPITVSASSTSPSIDITRATGSVNGYLASSDFTAFNSKLAPALTSASIFVGNGSNLAQAQVLSGDATIDNAGVMTLKSTGVSAGTYAKVQVDVKGRVVASASLISSDITTALGYTPGTGSGSVASVSADATAGNPITITGTATNPTVNLVKATASVNGYLSSGDWSIFNSKLSNFTTLTSADVTAALTFTPFSNLLSSGNIFVGNGSGLAQARAMSGDATIDSLGILTLTADSVTSADITNGSVGNAKISDVAFSKLTGKPTTLAGYTITMTSSDVTTALGYTPGSGSGTVGSVTSAATSGNPITVSGSSTSPSIDISRATASVNGYLASSDFSIFLAKGSGSVTSATAAATSGNPITVSASSTSPSIDISRATASVNGYLASSDFSIFAAKGSGSVTSATAASTSGNPITVSASSTSPSIDISRATALVNGYLASSDFSAFNNKVSSQWVTNGSSDISRVSGNVGIGTTTPGQKLSVAGTIESTTGGIKFPDGTVQTTSAASGANNSMVTGYPDFITCVDGGTTISLQLQYKDTTNVYYVYSSTMDIRIIYTLAGTYASNINLPSYDCVVSAFSISTLYTMGKAFNVAKGPAGQWLEASGNAYRNTGNVGIGTTTPGFALSVSGDVNVTGNFKINGTNIGGGSGTVTSATAAVTSGNPITVSASSTSPSIDISRSTALVNGYLASSDFTTFNGKQAGSTELTGLAALSTNGFVRRTAAGTYTSIASVDLTNSVVGLLPSANIASNAITSAQIVNGTITSSDLSSAAVEAVNLAQMGASTGQVMKWNGSNWVASADNTGGSGSLSSLTAATSANAISNLNFTQSWDWSTATTQNPMTMSANALTTGSLLNLTSSSGSLNSTNGILNVANTSTSITGTVARMQSNSTAGSGMTVLANGNVGIGTTTPGQNLTVTGTIESTTGGIKFPDGTIQTTSALGGVNNSMNSNLPDAIRCQRNDGMGENTLYIGNPSAPGAAVYVDPITNTVVNFNTTTKNFDSCSGSMCSLLSTGDCLNTSQGLTRLSNLGRAFSFAKGPAAQWLEASGNAYRNTGNVGIGTTAPNALLQVNGTTFINATAQDASVTSAKLVVMQTPATADWTQTVKGGTTTGSSYGIRLNAGTNSSDAALVVRDVTNTNDFFKIRGDGNVGIGTAAPSERLDLGTGNIKIGHEVIVRTVAGGSWTSGWFYAACTAGKYATGGSCTSSSGTAPTNTDTTGSAFGCYLPIGYEAQTYTIKAICMQVR
ncbi:MAG: hypothetical protein H7328_03240 [Bdellovibrio sp.]|nr:hypothetical protein [Bdellovibrio sp.]